MTGRVTIRTGTLDHRDGMKTATRRSPADRDRAVARLRALTIGSGIASAVAVGGFGALAAVTYRGASDTIVTAAAVTTTTPSTEAAAAAPTATSTTSSGSSTTPATTTTATIAASVAPTATTSTAHAATGSS